MVFTLVISLERFTWLVASIMAQATFSAYNWRVKNIFCVIRNPWMFLCILKFKKKLLHQTAHYFIWKQSPFQAIKKRRWFIKIYAANIQIMSDMLIHVGGYFDMSKKCLKYFLLVDPPKVVDPSPNFLSSTFDTWSGAIYMPYWSNCMHISGDSDQIGNLTRW